MRFKTGEGMFRYVRPQAIVSINNYRLDQAYSDKLMKGMSEVILIDGTRIVAVGAAAELYASLVHEERTGERDD